MLLVLEIMLTISAWRKGYKGFALLPVGIALFAGFLIGYSNPGSDALSFIWIDILAIVILVVMIGAAKVPEDVKVKETNKSGDLMADQNGQRELAANHPEVELN